MLDKLKKYGIPFGLFVLTFLSTTYAGLSHGSFQLMDYLKNNSDELNFSLFLQGMYYSVPFMLFLLFHEFGHYFMAKYHKVKTSLPYCIPMPLILIGTMGAVIRMKGRKQTKKQFFDIGIAGRLAGVVVAFAFLVYGFLTLPPQQDILKIHPEYQSAIEQHGLAHYQEHVYDAIDENTMVVGVGGNLLLRIMEKTLVANPVDVPGMYEMMHYPFIFAGYLALFFTALNLLPIGQLDGGHILYGLIGSKGHTLVSSLVFGVFVFYSGLGLEYVSIYKVPFDELLLNSALYLFFLFFLFKNVVERKTNALLVAMFVFSTQFFINYYFPNIEGYSGWFFYLFILSRVIGTRHPMAEIEEELTLGRKILGWLSLLIFMLCFSPQPFVIS